MTRPFKITTWALSRFEPFPAPRNGLEPRKSPIRGWALRHDRGDRPADRSATYVRKPAHVGAIACEGRAPGSLS
jgi:hypothetical protein